METLTLSLGTMVSKWILKLWLKDGPSADLVGEIPEIIGRHMSNAREARRANRQFEQLSETISDRVLPYLAHEFGDVPANEKEAAVLAVQGSLDKAALTTSDILDLDLDASALEAFVTERDPNAVIRAGLSEQGAGIYNLLLTECCSYTVQIVSSMPDFATAQAREMLERETELARLVEQVLTELPEPTVPRAWGLGSTYDRFENRYRKAVFSRADSLRIFGVDTRTARRQYSLSVAYISLSAASGDRDMSRAPELVSMREVGTRVRTEALQDAVRIETALGGNDRILIGGGAGSGKTTLLQWLAVTATREAFSGELGAWNGQIPFLIPLRRFVNSALPKPEDFVEVATPNLSGAMPQGWVHRVLEDGRGLVLIDGLDELPERRRGEVRAWLLTLIEDFPECRYLITSRTTGIPEEWDGLNGFHRVELLPMQAADIRAFIAHWHNAAVAHSSSDREPEIRAAERIVLATVRDRPAIRALCSSPLLCALICTLNRDRASKLPENRMELYEVALKMLVFQRDDERDIFVEQDVTLSFREVQALLESLALWLHENGATDAEWEIVTRRVEVQLRQLHRIEAPVENVAKHLIQRSGVLREPVPGRVDFVHRTFLEYLAAAALVEDESIDKMVLHAHEDHWREVIIMAAGHANRVQGERLLNGLIERGHVEPEYQHRLFLLALACLETCLDLGAGLQERLADCLEAVMPPSNMTDAAAVASAGPLAVPLLTQYQGKATEAAACVRALSMIGGDDAFEALKQFSEDARVTVARQLVRAWSQFDPRIYAEEVLSRSPLDRGMLNVSDPDLMQYVGLLEQLERIYLDAPGRLDDLEGLPALDTMAGIDMSHAKNLFELTGCWRFPNLEFLVLRNCSALTTVRGIEKLRYLRHLDLDGCVNLVDLDRVRDVPTLSTLDVSGTGVSSLNALEHSSLEQLTIVHAKRLRSLGEAIEAVRIVLMGCPALEDVSALAGSRTLRSLFVGSLPSLAKEVALPDSLEELSFYGTAEGKVVFTGAPFLRRLRLFRGWGLSDVVSSDWFEFACERAGLEQLYVDIPISEVTFPLERLSGHPSLRRIEIGRPRGGHVALPEVAGFQVGEVGGLLRYERTAV